MRARIWPGLAVRRGCEVVAALVLVCFALTESAFADPPSLEVPLRAGSYSVSVDKKRTVVELELNRNPNFTWFLLRSPYRLAIDLPTTQFVFEPDALKAKGLVTAVRYGHAGEGRSRLILTASGPFKVESVDIKPGPSGGKHRLSLRLEQDTVAAFDAALDDQVTHTASTTVSPAIAATGGDDRFTIVIDPGHGGIDGGAKGLHGTMEKAVTLTFSKELQKKLEETGRYQVILTRTDDQFIRLDERVAFARVKKADLFISVHADTIRLKGVRGATVYTVSDEASDAEAAALADRENLADQIAGIHIEEDNKEVADILVELVRRETHTFSVGFARSLVGELREITGMINNPHRHAGFRVLRAPDVPSVLVELGYLSNAKDEQQLLSPQWRARAADSIVEAVEKFAESTVSAAN